MKSEKVKELDPPAPTYEEDPTLQPGVEVEANAATPGSRWVTNLITKKNGEVISDEFSITVRIMESPPPSNGIPLEAWQLRKARALQRAAQQERASLLPQDPRRREARPAPPQPRAHRSRLPRMQVPAM